MVVVKVNIVKLIFSHNNQFYVKVNELLRKLVAKAQISMIDLLIILFKEKEIPKDYIFKLI